MFPACTGLKDFCEATHVQVGESFPIFGIVVDHQSGVGVASDIFDPLQLAGRQCFRFLIDRRIEDRFVQCITNRNYGRMPFGIRSRKMRHTMAFDESTNPGFDLH